MTDEPGLEPPTTTSATHGAYHQTVHASYAFWYKNGSNLTCHHGKGAGGGLQNSQVRIRHKCGGCLAAHLDAVPPSRRVGGPILAVFVLFLACAAPPHCFGGGCTGGC